MVMTEDAQIMLDDTMIYEVRTIDSDVYYDNVTVEVHWTRAQADAAITALVTEYPDRDYRIAESYLEGRQQSLAQRKDNDLEFNDTLAWT